MTSAQSRCRAPDARTAGSLADRSPDQRAERHRPSPAWSSPTPDRRARAYVRSLCTDAGLVAARGRRRQPLRPLGRCGRRRCPPSAPARTSTPSPTPACTTAPSACSAALEAHPRAARVGSAAAPIDRVADVHVRRAHALRHRLPRQPPAVRAAGRRRRRTRSRDRDGATLDDARRAAGFTGDLATVALPPGHYAAFVELHIEQGPLLEQRGIGLGVVTAIAAPASLRVTIDGEGGHAGAVLMPERRDAFLAGAEIALAVEAAASADRRPSTRSPRRGVCHVFPGAVNSVPSRCDARDRRPRHRPGPARRGAWRASRPPAVRRGSATPRLGRRPRSSTPTHPPAATRPSSTP